MGSVTNQSRSGKRRILWLIKGLDSGGAENLVLLTAKFRDRTEFAYELAWVLRERDQLKSSFVDEDVPVRCLDGSASTDLDIRWAIRLRRLLLERDFAVLHLHSPYAAVVARVVCRTIPANRRPALVHTEHIAWDRLPWPSRWANRLTYSLDDAHIAVSAAVRKSIPPRYQGQVRVVIHGVDAEGARLQLRDRCRIRAELGVGDGEVLVGTVANYREQKAYPDLLAAAAAVMGLEPNGRFVAVGHGPLEAEVQHAHRKLRLGDRFQLLGYREDAVAVLAACDIFVLSSTYEGLPVSLMEALVLGLPVVSTDVGGIGELVRDGVEGILVPPSSPDELAAGLLKLVRDSSLRSEMATAARVRSSELDIRRVVAEFEEIYRSLASSSVRET